jgi:hypothetical protein
VTALLRDFLLLLLALWTLLVGLPLVLTVVVGGVLP